MEAANKEDMTYLNRIAGKEFMDTFDRAVRLKEGIRRQSDKLDRAIRRNTGDAAKAARALQGLQSSYKAAEAELAALARVLEELSALEKQYPPETNKYLAPNGKQSKLNHAQWYAKRTPSFKKWFGDWEAAAKIEAGTIAPQQMINKW